MNLANIWFLIAFIISNLYVLPGLADEATKYQIAGVDVAVWRPIKVHPPFPLVIFSHGFHGSDTQSKFILSAMRNSGYLVVAPNHRDAMGGGGQFRPEVAFRNPEKWNNETFKYRHDDIVRLIDALHKDKQWNSQIDWSRVALAGHSLGGYTVLGLAGAWPSWGLPGVKAVLALSPYCGPFLSQSTLHNVKIPVMYQSGTRDFGILPFLKRKEGAYDQTSSPVYFVEFDRAGHLAWSNFNMNTEQQNLINYYCLSFLNKYVKGDATARPDLQYPGVADLRVK